MAIANSDRQAKHTSAEQRKPKIDLIFAVANLGISKKLGESSIYQQFLDQPSLGEDEMMEARTMGPTLILPERTFEGMVLSSFVGSNSDDAWLTVVIDRRRNGLFGVVVVPAKK